MIFKTIEADFGDRGYAFFYGAGAVSILGDQLNSPKFDQSKVIIVSHPELKDIYEKKLEGALSQSSRKVYWVLIPSGEKYKTLETVEILYEKLASLGVTKRTPVVALGGGVLQDLINFTTATYLRGVPFIQIPTTLLSQVDIGIGGCAVDHPKGKSLIGTFYQPKLAILDTDFLLSLPQDEIRNGMAEIINKAVCLAGDNPNDFKNDISKLLAYDIEVLSRYVMKSNAIKLAIIEDDEIGMSEKRFALDFGHTLTYAIEKATDYALPHGFALGIGMKATLLLSEEKAGLPHSVSEMVLSIIEQAGLPTSIPEGLISEELLSLMRVDQKVKDGMIRFVLISNIGKPFISEGISDDDLLKLINSMRK